MRIFAVLLPIVAAGVVQGVVIRTDPWPRTAVPLDGGRTWGGRPLLGPNKTWRGAVVMAASTAAAAALLFPVVPPVVPEPSMGWFLLGALIGVGYCLGELPNSFVKRRLGIPAGGSSPRWARMQYLADQGDSVVGVGVVLVVAVDVDWPWLLALAVAGLALHMAFDRALRATGVKPATGGG